MRRLIHIMLLLLLSSSLYGQDTKAQEEKRAKLEKEIAIIDKQLSRNASKQNAALSNLTLIKKKISNRKSLISETERQIRVCSDRIYQKQREINRLQAKVDTLSAHYSRLVMAAYKNRDARLWYMYILASDNLGQAFRRMAYFRNLSAQMNQDARKIRQTQEELEQQRRQQSLLKAEAEAVKKQRTAELAKLEGEQQQSGKIVKQLQRDKKKYQAQLAAKKKQVDALNREIERLVAEAMKSGGKTSSRKPVDLKLAAEFANNRGRLPWPAEGPVVDRFGQKYHPVYKNLKLPPNKGIDIALSHGTKVRAVFDGVVSRIVVMPGYNKCILVQHGNYFSFYCKLSSSSVKAGDKVRTGDVLGTIDTINDQTQLHFQIWKDNVPQNPEHWLR